MFVTIAISILFIGIICLVFEIIIPGFGIPGILGIICVVISAIMISQIPFGTYYITAGIAAFGIGLYFLYKTLRSRNSLNGFILNESLNDDVDEFQRLNIENLKGKEAKVLSPLRPYGLVEVDGIRINVFSEGDFISSGKIVKIVSIENNKIYVREVK